MVIFQNITEQKKAEKELVNAKLAARNVLEDLQTEKESLAHEKAKDDAMLASIGDGVIVVDPLGKITLINRSAQNLLGWNHHESLGKSLFEMVPILDERGFLVEAENHPMTVALNLSKGIHEDKNAFPEKNILSKYYYVRKDKTKFPVAVNFSRVVLKDKVIGAIEVFRDITKETEIDQAKSEFVSLASHQLRTPLTTINWYSEMLLQAVIGDNTLKRREYLSKIHAGSVRMVALVNALLNVSRIELGTLVADLKPIDVTKLIESVINEQKFQIEEKKLTVTTHFSESLPVFQTDANLLRMVFQNLLSNAVKYTPLDGRIDVTVVIAPDRSFLITFSDTGYGIPKKDISKIFTKMFRASNIKEKDVEGTGLGLYMVKSLLAILSGTVRFESEENKGTRFYVNLYPGELNNKIN